MRLLITVIFILILACSKDEAESKISDKKSYHDSDTVIVEKEDSLFRFEFDNLISYWGTMIPTRKYFHVMRMVEISDDAFRYKITNRYDEELTGKQVFQQVKNVTNCADSLSYKLETNVRIGSLLINCMIRNNFH